MDNYSFKDQPSSAKQATTYQRSYMRHIPSHQLQPYLNSRPVSTKYNIMPFVDGRKELEVPLVQQATYSQTSQFNPGNSRGPWSGYASNINHESELRNQFFALQRSSQASYIPSSKSNLYDVKWKNKETHETPFPNLFSVQEFFPFDANPNADIIGYALFNNATRQQLKDLTNKNKNKK
jgi:hypothetical protein